MIPIIAIDPGKAGGIALRSKDGEIAVHGMPKTDQDRADLLRSFRAEQGAACRAVIERVHGRPQGGASGMFNYGFGVGYLHAVLFMLGVPTATIPPQTWMKSLSLGTKGDRTDIEWKNALKSEAQRRFPDQKITLQTSDALLILTYAMKEID